jgi:hypothetical protein
MATKTYAANATATTPATAMDYATATEAITNTTRRRHF